EARADDAALGGADHADRLAARDGLAGRDRQLRHDACAMRVDLVLHLHRLDDAEELPRLDFVAVRDVDREDRALHRARHRVTPGRALRGLRAFAAAPGQVRPRRLAVDDRYGEAAAFDLDV